MRSHSMIYLDFFRPGFINNFQFLFTFVLFSKYYYLPLFQQILRNSTSASPKKPGVAASDDTNTGSLYRKL